MRVFLIHGMGRSRASMLVLASRLKRAGHLPSSFGYLVSMRGLDEIAHRFVAHLGRVLAADKSEGDEPPPYAVIGHSLGNVITRYASPRLPPGFCRFIMLAPPNRSPVLARALKENPLFRALTGDAGQRLADPGFFERLPVPEVPTLVLAGDGGPRARWLPFQGAPSDGVVGVDETRLDGALHETVPAIHTFIMNHPEVTRRVLAFLEHGDAKERKAVPPVAP